MNEIQKVVQKVKFRVDEFSPPYIILKGDYSREDISNLLWNTPGRVAKAHDTNGIPVGVWSEFRQKLFELENTDIVVSSGAMEKIYEFLAAPNISVGMISDHFAIKIHEKGVGYRWMVANLPGCVFDNSSGRGYYKLNLSEGYRLFEDLKEVPNLVFTEECQEYIKNQIKSRAELDKVAKLEDVSLHIPSFNGEFRPFQRVGIKFIDLAEGKAIVADEMGLGKTWEGLGYSELILSPKTLVVCPASLKPNWCREIRLRTGEEPYVLSGTKPTNVDIINLLTSPKRYVIANYDILARKQETYKEGIDGNGMKHIEKGNLWYWVEVLKLYKPALLLIDEAHYIKNPDSARSIAVRMFKDVPKIVAMTGTPLLNRPGELWPILNLLFPSQFPAYETFLKQYTYNNKRARNSEELRKMLKNSMIRRLKKDVIKELPPINRINEYFELSEAAKASYNKVMAGVYQTLKSWGGEIRQSEVTNVLTQILRLKQVCAFDKMDFIAELATEIYDSAEDSPYKKVLIFSQFVDVANGIAKRLGQEAISAIDMKPEERFKVVDKFQNEEDIHFLITTTKAASEGLNITKAGTVIFADQMWNPAAHSQAEGRAYGRLNDSHSITSYYVIAEKTIEEWIMDMIDRKFKIIKEVVEDLNDIRDESIAMNLIQKLKEEMWTFKKL